MEKVKIFASLDKKSIEDNINEFLSSNIGIEITRVLQSSSEHVLLIISIFYKEIEYKKI